LKEKLKKAGLASAIEQPTAGGAGGKKKVADDN